MRSKHETIKFVTDAYLAQINSNNLPSADDMIADILDRTQNVFTNRNKTNPDKQKWKVLDHLEPSQISDVMLKVHRIVNIAGTGLDGESAYDILAVYMDNGKDKGIYISDEKEIDRLVQRYHYTIKKHELDEVKRLLSQNAERVEKCSKKNLIAVNNGIFDYDTKQLLPFSPDYIFTAKSRVNYNPAAKNITIHNPDDGTDWDVETWMQSLSDDPEIVNTLWEVLGAIIRPNVSWDKSAWFYSETGNNGKGTLCELMRELCGKNSYAAIPLSEMGKDFMLEPLIKSTAIITDENDVGIEIDKAANLKSLITGDALFINRKFKTPISYKFKGFMVQCLNEMPRIKDKSDSFYRRQLFIPFTKCFTGMERKYIKHDYLHRKEVLEYVLYKVLNTDYYVLSTPDACTKALDEYKEYNDSVRLFANEMFPVFVWDLLPFTFLHDLYREWYKRTFNRNDALSKPNFTKDLLNILKNFPDWECPDKTNPIKTSCRMAKPEPLIDEYDLAKWMNPMYLSSKDINKKCLPPLKSAYRGITRITPLNP